MTGNPSDISCDNLVDPITPSPARFRLEIDELLADNEVTNLYLLALEAMQNEATAESTKQPGYKEDWWTFYSLASIHGQPPEKWNGVPNGDEGKPPYGYCKHGSVLFPTWHRVYMYMFEQAITKKVYAIAAQYPEGHLKALYKNAADRFRLPFWDPFLPRNRRDGQTPLYKGVAIDIWGIPKILGAETVWVRRPQGTDLEEMPNPLYRFKFPKEADIIARGRKSVTFSDDLSKKGRLYTIRSPGLNGGTNIYEHEYQARLGLNLKIQRQGSQLMTKLWKLLAPYDEKNDIDNRSRTWESFASHTVYKPGTQDPEKERNPNDPCKERIKMNDTSVSLESWHDAIHNLVGTGTRYEGHMADPAVAGFDPVFFLHHCNIDRILAIYQALYDDKWVSTFGEENDSTGLYPFLRTEHDPWTSKDTKIKDWTRLGFAVPGDKPLTKERKKILERYVNAYYSWGAGGASAPPPSVSNNWPKNLSNSQALNGPDAGFAEDPLVEFDLLDDSSIATRSVALPTFSKREAQVTDEAKKIVVGDDGRDTTGSSPRVADGGQEHTWNARIRILKFAFDGSFNIHLFIGGIKDTQPERYLTKKNEVGFTGVFASAHNAPCANCNEQRAQGLIYEDAIPITSSLYEYLPTNNAAGPEASMRTLESLDPQQVVPFLKTHLNWVVTDTKSKLINDEHAIINSKLEILVSRRTYDLPTADNPLGNYHTSEEYPEITAGKVGGYGPPSAGTT